MADEQISRQEELRDRTKRFALRIIRLFRHLPRSTEAQVLGKQLLRSRQMNWSPSSPLLIVQRDLKVGD